MILRILFFITIIIPSLLFAQTESVVDSTVTTQPEVTEAQSIANDDNEEKAPQTLSIEDLMLEKLDVVKKVEKIEKIESVVEGSSKSGSSPVLNKPEEKKGYRPLFDKDPKTVQASPPFSLQGN